MGTIIERAAMNRRNTLLEYNFKTTK